MQVLISVAWLVAMTSMKTCVSARLVVKSWEKTVANAATKKRTTIKH